MRQSAVIKLNSDDEIKNKGITTKVVICSVYVHRNLYIFYALESFIACLLLDDSQDRRLVFCVKRHVVLSFYFRC